MIRRLLARLLRARADRHCHDAIDSLAAARRLDRWANRLDPISKTGTLPTCLTPP